MAARAPDPTFDPFREDLVDYLAKRLDVPHDVALSMLGDWLLDRERRPMRGDGGSSRE
jgi:hypothetical protein